MCFNYVALCFGFVNNELGVYRWLMSVKVIRWDVGGGRGGAGKVVTTCYLEDVVAWDSLLSRYLSAPYLSRATVSPRGINEHPPTYLSVTIINGLVNSLVALS